MAKPTCPQCQYDLTGHVGPDVIRCPECGREWSHLEIFASPRPRIRWLGVMASLICGAVLWIVINSSSYWEPFMPWMASTAVIVFYLGVRFPVHAWLCGLLVLLGQFVAAIGAGGSIGAAPIDCFGALLIPVMLLAQSGGYLGAWLRNRE